MMISSNNICVFIYKYSPSAIAYWPFALIPLSQCCWREYAQGASTSAPPVPLFGRCWCILRWESDLYLFPGSDLKHEIQHEKISLMLGFSFKRVKHMRLGPLRT